MPKYIRTKEGRIHEIGKERTSFFVEKDTGWVIDKDSVIKSSDTIEELCDEFVAYYMDLNEMSKNEIWQPYAQYERCGYVWQHDKDNLINRALKSHNAIYGAIWTEWGLRYVAKMNDKGELELL